MKSEVFRINVLMRAKPVFERNMAHSVAPRGLAVIVAGFTVLELIVSIAIIAIVMAVLLPAVMSCREASRVVQCRNHLHQLGLAVQMHHDAHRQLPAAWKTSVEKPLFARAWGQDLLPYLEQESFANRDIAQWQSLLAANPAAGSLEVFLCPSDITAPSFNLAADDGDDDEPGTESLIRGEMQRQILHPVPANSDELMRLPTANYIGVYGTVEADEYGKVSTPLGLTYGDGSVIHQRRIRFCDLRRGLSQTLVIGERTMAYVPSTWLGVDLRGEDAACRITGSAITHPNCEPCDECEFSSRHPGGSNFLFADGHVELVTESIDRTLYRQLARRNP